MRSMSVLRATLAASFLSLSLSALSAHAEDPPRFDLPAQPLVDSLRAVASRTQMNVFFEPKLIAGRQAPAISNTDGVDAALQKLLEGSGLTFRFIDERTVTVVPEDKALKEAKAPTAGNMGSGEELMLAQAGTAGDATSGAQSGDQQNGADGEESSQGVKLEEIVVTAQKRREREQDVPSSITVLSGSQLAAQGAVRLADYAKQIPGLNLISGAGPGQGTVTMRGISTGADRSALVGIFLDEVPFAPSSSLATFTAGNPRLARSFDPDIADVERIEVLSGPQSTLYGASAAGGILKFVTRKPEFNRVEGGVRVQGGQIDGGGSSYGLRGSLNVPISDNLAIRASASYREDPGFVDNLFYHESNVNQATAKGGRLSLRARISDRVETTISGHAENMDASGPTQLYPIDRPTLKPLLGDYAYSSSIREPYSNLYRALGDTTTVEFGFATLTNILSYANMDSESRLNYGSLSGSAGGNPVTYNIHARSTRYSDELRLASRPGSVEWLAGAFYTDERNPLNIVILGTDPAGVPLTSPSYNVITQFLKSTYEEWAGFGDLTYHFTPKIEGTVGVRYSSNRQSFHVQQSGVLVSPDNMDRVDRSTDSATSYLATVVYRPGLGMTIYGRAASAYRPGGPNILTAAQAAAQVPASFKSDELWNYEIGLKGALWDQRLAYSLAAYRMNWTDLQMTLRFGPHFSTGNAGKAKSDGAEMSIDLRPVHGLTLGLRGAYCDASITTDAPTLNAVNGDSLPYSPKFTAAVLVDYESPVVNNVSGSVGLTYAHRGSQASDFSRSAAYVTLPSYNTLDLRAGLHWQRFSLIAVVDNVTNAFGLTNVSPSRALGAPLAEVPIRPRTYGVSLETTF